MKSAKLLTAFVLCSLQLWCSASAVLEHELDSARKYINRGRYSSAIRQLERTGRTFKNDAKAYGQVMTMLAGCQNLTGKYKQALKTLDKIKSSFPHQYKYEQASAFLGLKEYQKALDSVGGYIPQHGQYLYLKAMWIKAQVEMELKRHKNCMSTCWRVMYQNLSQAPKGFADQKLANSAVNELKKIKTAARKLYYEAREAYDIKTYGVDFANYRKAREAHFAKQYPKARELYALIKAGTLKEAAICYSAETYLDAGDEDEAAKLFARAVKTNPYGLYQGEMLYNLAVIYYLKGRASTALQSAAALEDWCANVEDKTRAKLENINAALKKDIIDTAPRTYLQTDNCANLIATKKYPGTIDNHLTSPWYLPNLKVKGALLHGFLLGERKQIQAAAEKYDKAQRITKMQIVRNRLTIKNLKAGLLEKSYLFSEEVIHDASSDWENHLRYAAFCYLTDETDKAAKLFGAVAKNARRNNPYDALLARLGTIYCFLASKNENAAMKEIDSLLKSGDERKYKELFAEARFLRACVWAKNQNTLPRAITEFQMLSKRSNDPCSSKALLALALAAVNNNKTDVATDACRSLSRRRADAYQQAGKTLLAAIKGYDPKENRKQKIKVATSDVNAPGTGKIIKHRRVVVMPSITDWKTIRAEVKAEDIVYYRIKFVPRNNCMIVRKSWIKLSPGEPSPPAAIGDEVCFVRAPALFNKSLLYDFKQLEQKQR